MGHAENLLKDSSNSARSLFQAVMAMTTSTAPATITAIVVLVRLDMVSSNRFGSDGCESLVAGVPWAARVVLTAGVFVCMVISGG